MMAVITIMKMIMISKIIIIIIITLIILIIIIIIIIIIKQGLRNADCVERPRKVSRMCYQAVVRHDTSKICNHAICSEYDNFPTCSRLEYLAFLDDPEEPVDKGFILIANISTVDIIIRNTTEYHVLKRVHQLLPSTRSYN